jgi:hypothetical protein
MPEEVLQELMVNAQMLEEAEDVALPHGEMPGGLPGDNFVRLNFLEEGDVEDAEPAPASTREVDPAADRAHPVPEDDDEEEDEDEDVEEVGTFILDYCSRTNGSRLRHCPFVSCVIWLADSGVELMLKLKRKRKPRRMQDHREKLSWMV